MENTLEKHQSFEKEVLEEEIDSLEKKIKELREELEEDFKGAVEELKEDFIEEIEDLLNYTLCKKIKNLDYDFNHLKLERYLDTKSWEKTKYEFEEKKERLLLLKEEIKSNQC